MAGKGLNASPCWLVKRNRFVSGILLQGWVTPKRIPPIVCKKSTAFPLCPILRYILSVLHFMHFCGKMRQQLLQVTAHIGPASLIMNLSDISHSIFKRRFVFSCFSWQDSLTAFLTRTPCNLHLMNGLTNVN